MKTWKESQDATAGMQIGENHAQVSVATAAETNGLYVDESGTYLRGKMSLMTSPDQIRVGGLWTFGSPWLMMFPSTTAFPIPTLNLSPPVKGIADMATAVAWMMSLLT